MQYPHVIDERRAYEHVGYHDPQNTIPWGVIHSQQCFVQNGKAPDIIKKSHTSCPNCDAHRVLRQPAVQESNGPLHM